MKTPFEISGVRGFTDEYGQFVCTGSAMGRRNSIPSDADTVRKLHLRRVMPHDGDYDKGGAYWGDLARNPLFCAWGESDTEQAHVFVRAPSREQAKAKARESFRNATFYR